MLRLVVTGSVAFFYEMFTLVIIIFYNVPFFRDITAVISLGMFQVWGAIKCSMVKWPIFQQKYYVSCFSEINKITLIFFLNQVYF